MSHPRTHRRSRWRIVTQLAAVASSAALAATLLAAPASANPEFVTTPDPQRITGPALDHPDHDPLATAARAYLASYPEMSAEAAIDAAVAQQAGVELKEAILERWDSFGGGWFDPTTATYHFAVTDDATARDLTGLGRELAVAVETQLVERTLAELERQVDELATSDHPAARAADGQIGIDLTTNQVVLAVPAAELTALRADPPADVRLVADPQIPVEADVCTSRANCDDELRAGLALRRSGALVCSLGFTARSSDTFTRFALTAGHCHGTDFENWSNGTTTVRSIGPLLSVNAFDSGRVDMAAIQVTNPFYASHTAGRIATGPSSSAPVTGLMILFSGDVVCLSASFQDPTRSGNPCATVSTTSDFFNRGLARISGYDACPGDSGGGWYWLPGNNTRWAVALHSRSSPGCNSFPHWSWASLLTSQFTGLIYDVG